MAVCIRWAPLLLAVCLLATTETVAGAPEGFPASGNGVWDTAPSTSWARGNYPVGNGYLAAMIPGGTTLEMTSLNLESLWTGGPFQNSSYNGGNKQASQRTSLKTEMDRIRASIFSSSSGTVNSVSSLMTDPTNFGSYAGAGYLFTTMSSKGSVTNYARWLDLDQAVVHATWVAGNVTIDRKTFCSYPAQACVQQTSSSASQNLTFAYSLGPDPGLTAINVTCFNSSTLQVRGHAGSPGMLYELLFHASSSTVSCQSAQPYDTSVATANATLSASGADVTVVWVGNTEYSMDAGDEAHDFSFKGDDPHSALASRISSLSGTSAANLLSAHVADVKATLTGFKLDLGQTAQLDSTTATLLTAYKADTGNPYIEWLLFNFGRYMLWSSSRGTLPANLQGKWAHKLANTWNSDYHLNINVQMNLWSAEPTNLDVTQSVFDYMEKTWVPRGTQTAQILYDSDEGWVTHDEVNIFGHTGMKAGSAQSLNYPEANAWMMIHVWDHFDYTNDVSWWKSQGYPLLKGAAQFHLNKLIPDLHFNDSSLVVAPCNSPEQTYITLGCAHAQQLIWQLFNAVDKGFSASGDTDTDFLNAIRTARTQMDKGIHIGSWGQLQEWKVDMDDSDDDHRHLSHLIGLYPGYALASYDVEKQGTAGSSKLSYTKAQVINATTTSLTHRGDGTGSDGDAGWEKMWRAAAWAQLGDAEQFYHEITLAIEKNFVVNLWSTYDPNGYEPVQIDANLGHPAAVLNALVQAPDVASYDDPLVVSLLPALPAAWPKGSITGARLRGGMAIDFSWSGGALKSATITVANSVVPRDVQVVVGGKVVKEFTTKAGMVQTI